MPSIHLASKSAPAPSGILLAIGGMNSRVMQKCARMPSTTPTRPALEGVIMYVKVWATSHPSDKVIVVLATDGDPSGATIVETPGCLFDM